MNLFHDVSGFLQVVTGSFFMVVFSSDCFRLCWKLYFVFWLFWPVISCVPVVSGFLLFRLFRVVLGCFKLFSYVQVVLGRFSALGCVGLFMFVMLFKFFHVHIV